MSDETLPRLWRLDDEELETLSCVLSGAERDLPGSLAGIGVRLYEEVEEEIERRARPTPADD